MNRYVLLAFIVVAFSCNTKKSGMQGNSELSKNKYNLILGQKKKCFGVELSFPEGFKPLKTSAFAFTSNSETYYSAKLDAYLIVEEITTKSLKNIIGEPIVMNNIDMYQLLTKVVEKRYHTLESASISISKAGLNNKKRPFLSQTLRGVTKEYQREPRLYSTTIMDILNKFYIFQYICSEEIMAYTHDDFIAILMSVRKK